MCLRHTMPYEKGTTMLVRQPGNVAPFGTLSSLLESDVGGFGTLHCYGEHVERTRR